MMPSPIELGGSEMEKHLTKAHRTQWREFDAKHGHQTTLEAITAVLGLAELHLYSMSLDWLHGDFALKCKGGRGDLLVIFDA